ncbi:hypothetical protein [Pseudovibrio exalbescens]|uniref:hypothetical protein n=1 Tax=Pseudovibrio exalbescens TaxID=197461 RepID=UPI0015E0B2FF|nr:hypothetical protein [Pseudovibrio exalbescens]
MSIRPCGAQGASVVAVGQGSRHLFRSTATGERAGNAITLLQSKPENSASN